MQNLNNISVYYLSELKSTNVKNTIIVKEYRKIMTKIKK